MPAIHLRGREVARAALVTTVLFLAVQLGIGIYLGNSATASAYGAAGSLAVLMLRIDYSSAIFLLGAELDKFRLGSPRGKPEEPSRSALPSDAIEEADSNASALPRP